MGAFGRGAPRIGAAVHLARVGVLLAGLVVDLRRHSEAALAAEPGRDVGSVTLGRAKDRLSHASTNAQRSLPAAARGT
jgi:hypothetical protein